MASNLRSQERFPFHKLIRVCEFYELTASTYFCPFILHLFALSLVSHARFLCRSFRPPLVCFPQGNQISYVPQPVCNASGHCRGHA